MLLVSYIHQYFNTSITLLTNQVWKWLIALFKVPNTGALTRYPCSWISYTDTYSYPKCKKIGTHYCIGGSGGGGGGKRAWPPLPPPPPPQQMGIYPIVYVFGNCFFFMPEKIMCWESPHPPMTFSELPQHPGIGLPRHKNPGSAPVIYM